MKYLIIQIDKKSETERSEKEAKKQKQNQMLEVGEDIRERLVNITI